MSSTLERLRRLHGLREQSSRTDIETSSPTERSAESVSHATDYVDPARNGRGSSTRLEDLVPGVEIENSGGVCYMTTRAVPLTQPRGPQPMQALLAHSPALLHPFHPQFNLHDDTDFRRAAFITPKPPAWAPARASTASWSALAPSNTFQLTTTNHKPPRSTLHTQHVIRLPLTSLCVNSSCAARRKSARCW